MVVDIYVAVGAELDVDKADRIGLGLGCVHTGTLKYGIGTNEEKWLKWI